MMRNKPPLSVVIVACVYIAVGVLGFINNFTGLLAFQQDAVWAELTECVAIVAGVFMLRGHNWARWLALAWIVFHVILSAFHAFPEMAMHGVLAVVIAWFLFRPEGTRYFRRT